MAYREPLEWPHKNLAKVSEPVKDFDENLQTLLIDLEDTLRIKQGAGLAAPQIGFSQRVMIIDCSPFDFNNPDKESSPLKDENIWVIINPKISDTRGSVKWEEGCLSVPWHTTVVERFADLTLEYQTPDGTVKIMDLEFPISGAVQHEADHLDGKLYLDRIGKLTASRIKKSISKKRKKLVDFKADLLRDPSDKKVTRIKKLAHLSRKERKKRKMHRRSR